MYACEREIETTVYFSYMLFKKVTNTFLQICKVFFLTVFPNLNVTLQSYEGIGHGHLYFSDCRCLATFNALKFSAIVVTLQ